MTQKTQPKKKVYKMIAQDQKQGVTENLCTVYRVVFYNLF